MPRTSKIMGIDNKSNGPRCNKNMPSKFITLPFFYKTGLIYALIFALQDRVFMILFLYILEDVDVYRNR